MVWRKVDDCWQPCGDGSAKVSDNRDSSLQGPYGEHTHVALYLATFRMHTNKDTVMQVIL